MLASCVTAMWDGASIVRLRKCSVPAVNVRENEQIAQLLRGAAIDTQAGKHDTQQAADIEASNALV